MSFLKKILKSNTASRELRREQAAAAGGGGGEDAVRRPHNLTTPPATHGGGAVQTGGGGGKRSRSSSSAGSRSNSPSPVSAGGSPRPPTTYEIRYSTNPHVAQVLPGLLLGSQQFAQDLSALQRHKVTHILNITGEVQNSFPERFQYLRVAVSDMPNIKLEQFFTQSFAFINDARASGGTVLVHCFYGNSRSASLVIGYLMRTEHMRYREALAYLQMLRPEVYPNDGFEKQLREYEQKLWRPPQPPPTTTPSPAPAASTAPSRPATVLVQR